MVVKLWGKILDYQFWSLALGLISILLAQAEQSLRFWLDDFQKERPVYRGNWLPLMATMAQKLKAHQKTVMYVIPCISFLRWLAVILAIGSLFIGALK